MEIKITKKMIEGASLFWKEWCEEGNMVYEVYNQSKNELIGRIEKIRNGTWMHWSFVIPLYLMIDCVNKEQFLSYSPGCQDEIREFCKELNGFANRDL